MVHIVDTQIRNGAILVHSLDHSLQDYGRNITLLRDAIENYAAN